MGEKQMLTGMVLSAAPIGDYDKRVVLLTRERGKISGFARGARRQNSALLAATKPFSFGVFECYEGRGSYQITQAEIRNYFADLARDCETACLGTYFLEFADYYAREGTDEGELLTLLYLSLRALENPRLPKELVRCVYELRAMVINGEYPQVFACAACGSTEHLTSYSHRRNGVLCQDCAMEKGAAAILPSTLYAMQYVISAPIAKLYTFTVTDEVLREFARIQNRFRDAIIDKKFRSLAVLEEMGGRASF